MVGRAANTIPVRGICPPTSSGFERPATLSKGVNSKYLLGHHYEQSTDSRIQRLYI